MLKYKCSIFKKIYRLFAFLLTIKYFGNVLHALTSVKYANLFFHRFNTVWNINDLHMRYLGDCKVKASKSKKLHQKSFWQIWLCITYASTLVHFHRKLTSFSDNFLCFCWMLADVKRRHLHHLWVHLHSDKLT